MTWKRIPGLMIGIGSFALVCGWLAAAWGQTPPTEKPPPYVYVGLNNNIGRIDAETGRVWVLKVVEGVDRRAGVNDIVTYPQHAWRWTEVRVVGTHGEPETPPEGGQSEPRQP